MARANGLTVFAAVAFQALTVVDAASVASQSAPPVKMRAESADESHSAYPRPTMVREEWMTLNGPWDCGLGFWMQTNRGVFDRSIQVPFPVESVSSGVKRICTEAQRLWYRRDFAIPPQWKGNRIVLHFEAADWETKVWLNGHMLGPHCGGYDRFSFEITEALKLDGPQELVVSVYDPTEAGIQPRGKQMVHPKEPFFHASSGIWQTVWLEPVPAISIESLKLVPNVDAGVLEVAVACRGETNHAAVALVAMDGDKEVSRAIGGAGENIRLFIPTPKLWSPDKPFLYDLKVTLLREGQKADEVSSYFGMRKISVAKDENGFPRLMLNNKRLFQLGPLDQGYWPDGLYTAPSDEALRYDIEVMKQLGFNMCRKHVKIEPERWYYWCDKLGLLVWQDMPNGDRPASAQQKEIKRQPESARQFEEELKRMILGRGNHPCIVMWIPFNQGWGQYDTARISALVKQLDPSRLVISASGWHDLGVGDVRALHQYPGPATPVHDGVRPCVLGECGAFALAITNHISGPMGHWNATPMRTADELTERYLSLLSQIQLSAEKKGLSGAVVTQLTDVETEDDGFLTYDRAVIKMPVDKIREANERAIRAGSHSAK
jgi:hypothetical protein